MTLLPPQYRCCLFATRCCVPATAKWLLAGVFWLSLAGTGLADYQENYESAEPALRLVDADCAAELIFHQRVFAGAHSGVGCERLVMRAGRGTRVYLEQPIPPAQVIDELKVRLWIKGNRPGFQLLARVVLPRSIDRRTGQPMTTLVWGTSYRDAGGWQALTLSGLPKLVQRQVRVLSSEGGEPIDGRQAYIDRIVINAYGGVGLAELLVDDLEIEGHAAPSRPHDSPPPPDLPAARPTSRRPISSPPHAAELPPARLDDRETPIRVRGSVLVVHGRPLFARGTLHGGESLAWLRSLGLNTVVLSDACGPEQRAIAEKLELWLVVPRPAQRDATASIRPAAAEWPVATTGQPGHDSLRLAASQAQQPFDRVLAVLAATAAQDTKDTGAAAAVNRGPLLLTRVPRHGASLSARSVPGDLFLVDAPRPFGGPQARTDLPDPIVQFASERPTWVLEDTDRLVQAALADKTASPEKRQEHLLDALRAAMLRSITSGARGWCLTNALPESLPAADVPRWTAALEIAQRELELINPWISAGLLASPLAAPAPGWQACALEVNRSRLIIVTRDSMTTSQTSAEGVATAKAGSGTSGEWGTTARQFTSASVPRTPQFDVVDTGAPTSCDAYLLGGTALRPLERQRVAGGVRVRIEAPTVAALIVFTQDPLVVNYLARRGAGTSPRPQHGVPAP